MKKSFLLAIALLVTIPAYMAFIISRSEKDRDNFIQRYHYPDMTSFSVTPGLNVWVEQNDSNYMECKGCDTTGMFVAQTLHLDKSVDFSYIFYDSRQNWHYKMGLKDIASVKSEHNSFYIKGLRQKSLQVMLSAYSEIGLEDCELDTLLVNIEDLGMKELYVGSDCRIKYIIIESKHQSPGFTFSAFSGADIENLVVNDLDGNDFGLNLPAELLAKINFKLNGRQVTTADSTTTSRKND